MVGQMFCGWVGVHVSLVVACRVPYYTKITRVKAPYRHQPTFCIFSELYGFFSISISLQRATLRVSSSRSCLGISLETLLGNSSVECDPVWKPHLAVKDDQLSFHSPITRSPRWDHVHRFPCTRIPHTLQKAHQFQPSLPALLPLPHPSPLVVFRLRANS